MNQPIINPARDHYQGQVDIIADALQELMVDGPEIARKGLAEAIGSWYDYHYQEMQKWQILVEMIKSDPSLTGSMEMR